MILLLFFFWADLSQWGQKQKKEINSQGLIKMFITQKLVNLTPSGQIQVTHKLIIPLIIPSPLFQDFHDFSSFLISENWGWASNEKFSLYRQMKISTCPCLSSKSVSSRVERTGKKFVWFSVRIIFFVRVYLQKSSFTNLCSCLSNYMYVCRPQFFVVASVS